MARLKDRAENDEERRRAPRAQGIVPALGAFSRGSPWKPRRLPSPKPLSARGGCPRAEPVACSRSLGPPDPGGVRRRFPGPSDPAADPPEPTGGAGFAAKRCPPSSRSDEPLTDRPTRGFDLYGRYAGLGMQFAATIGLFAWAGWWLDGKLGTRPIVLIVGVLLGFLGGLVSLVHKVPPPRGRSRGTADRGSKADDRSPPPPR